MGGSMKGKELIQLLQGYEDYDITLCFYDKFQEDKYVENKIPWPPYRHMIVGSIVDIGVSDKVVLLDAKDI
jgi:hypothetical protein